MERWNSFSCCCGVVGTALAVLGTLGVDGEGVELPDIGLDGTPTLGVDGALGDLGRWAFRGFRAMVRLLAGASAGGGGTVAMVRPASEGYRTSTGTAGEYRGLRWNCGRFDRFGQARGSSLPVGGAGKSGWVGSATGPPGMAGASGFSNPVGVAGPFIASGDDRRFLRSVGAPKYWIPPGVVFGDSAAAGGLPEIASPPVSTTSIFSARIASTPARIAASFSSPGMSALIADPIKDLIGRSPRC